MRTILLPPRVMLALLTVSVIVGLAVPVAGPLPWPVRVAGALIAIPSLLVSARSAGRFREVGTNILPYRDPDILVAGGDFRWTRNPMYVGFLGVLVGVAFAVGSLSGWIGAVVYFLYSQLWIIPFEGERMAAQFGDAFAEYRRRVPRWIGPVRS